MVARPPRVAQTGAIRILSTGSNEGLLRARRPHKCALRFFRVTNFPRFYMKLPTTAACYLREKLHVVDRSAAKSFGLRGGEPARSMPTEVDGTGNAPRSQPTHTHGQTRVASTLLARSFRPRWTPRNLPNEASSDVVRKKESRLSPKPEA